MDATRVSLALILSSIMDATRVSLALILSSIMVAIRPSLARMLSSISLPNICRSSGVNIRAFPLSAHLEMSVNIVYHPLPQNTMHILPKVLRRGRPVDKRARAW